MDFLLNIFRGSYEELWKAIIRPYRDEYNDKDLGPEKFRLNSKYYKRTDLSIRNNRKQLLKCSYWEPYDEEREYSRLPCVIYLHGNSSSRCEVVPNLKYMLPLNITVFSFDFAACGRSEGEYISLGWYEILDVKCVIDYLRSTKKVGPIGLWGRSMGAVTSIMYASRDPTIAGIFIDSPFFSLNLLMDELSKEKVALPGFLVKKILIKIQETVKEKAGFNIDDIDTEKYCKKCFVPAFFCHGKDDTFVRLHHSMDLFKVYPGEKDILIVEGDHNDIRPNELNEKSAEFFYNALKCRNLKEINNYYYGYKMNFKEWNNPKFQTPTGIGKKNNIKNNESNEYINGFFQSKFYSETIPVKNEPENNYAKKRFINKNKMEKNNNLKFNNKLKNKLTNTNEKKKSPEKDKDKINNSDYINLNAKKLIQYNDTTKNIKYCHSKDNLSNVNFNNYKKVKINTGLLCPKDSFKNHNKINSKNIKLESQPKIINTDLDSNYYREKIYNREIIKINYPNKPKYNSTINNFIYNKSSNSVNKNRINNNIIKINNNININKNIISFKPIQQNITKNYPSQTLNPIKNKDSYISTSNNNLNKITNENSNYEHNQNGNNNNYYYYNTNNKIYVNQIQNYFYV